MEGDHFSRVLVYNTSCIILKRNVTELEKLTFNKKYTFAGKGKMKNFSITHTR